MLLQVEYELEKTVDYLDFEIDSASGVIKTRTTFNRESKSDYVIHVIAQDKGSPQESTTTYVDIELLDGNPESPVISPKEYHITVDEDMNLGNELLKVCFTTKSPSSFLIGFRPLKCRRTKLT